MCGGPGFATARWWRTACRCLPLLLRAPEGDASAPKNSRTPLFLRPRGGTTLALGPAAWHNGRGKAGCPIKRVKITVLRKEFYPEYADAYLTEGREVGPCPMLEVGDTFVFEGGAQMPQGFCPWAWVDIYNSVSALAAGASYAPWNNREGQTIVCCTDGIRPVVFELHAMEEGE